MAEIIPFPQGRNRPTQNPECDPIDVYMVSGNPAFQFSIIGDCTELMHHFDAVPGRCRCGERIWDDLSESPRSA